MTLRSLAVEADTVSDFSGSRNACPVARDQAVLGEDLRFLAAARLDLTVLLLS